MKKKCLFGARKKNLEMVALLELMMMMEIAVLSYCHEEYRMKEKEFGLTLIKS